MFSRVHIRSLASVNYLVKSIPRATPVPSISRKKEPKVSNSHLAPSGDFSRFVYTCDDLNDYFRTPEYEAPTSGQIDEAEALFSGNGVKHEFTCANYNDLPDLKVARQEEIRRRKLDKVDLTNWSEYHDNLALSRTSFGIQASLLKPLPEILLIGHTNAGKLTLINNLLLSRQHAKAPKAEIKYARVSKKAGYTQYLNFFNVGNKIRLVDSPGYGRFGKREQGNLVMQYIRERKQLRRTYIVIDSNEGVREEDAHLIEFLVECGAPFEIIFTKVDSLAQKTYPAFNFHPAKDSVEERLASYEFVKEGNSRIIAHFQNIIEESGLNDLATLPRLLFNNGMGGKYLKRRQGYRAIRFSMLESCGLIKRPGKPMLVEAPISNEENKGRRKRVTRSPRVKEINDRKSEGKR